ncbi:nitroreductase family protein [Colletotrichum truncatum]|uniref:Nitroreductase family protein n=1 Tax=Colletotrichum truncatum TaxID=5467 RepID=A0ACC3YK56_COLTU|nr:nitroreductase family protein [Colletotrichum truncatum]KAF6784371.1 nitroreductase family protein [Colletotrichum truncatum]
MSSNANAILDAVKTRRSHYPLSKDLPISKERIEEIIKTAVAYVPTSVNSQSTRVVVLHGVEHEKFWDMTASILKAIVSAEQWEYTSGKVASFRGGAGTVLFYENEDDIKALQEKFPMFAERFHGWAAQSDAMLQFTLWIALDAEGLGVNLQHYNPLVDEQVAAEWNIPSTWKLNAQLVFGGKKSQPDPKESKPIEELFKAYGS